MAHIYSLFQANRAELTPQQLQRVQYEGAECVIDRNLARDDAQKLFQAGEKKLGTDESVFLQVMAVRHYYQLRATFEEYVRVRNSVLMSQCSYKWWQWGTTTSSELPLKNMLG